VRSVISYATRRLEMTKISQFLTRGQEDEDVSDLGRN